MIEGPTLAELIERVDFKIDQIKILIQSLLIGIKSMTEEGIVHRDIKPENIMFELDGYLDTLKIIDFGLSVDTNEPKTAECKVCGTPGYIAPEIFNRGKNDFWDLMNSKIDIFSVGVIFYQLLFNHKIFGKRMVLEKNKIGKFRIPEMSKILTKEKNEDAYHLLKWMLETCPQDRCTVKEALSHKFFQNSNKREDLIETGILMDEDDSQFDVPTEPETNIGIYLSECKPVVFKNKFMKA